MNSQDKDNEIPEDIISSLFNPILEIDPLDASSRNLKLKEFFNNIIREGFKKYFQIIENYSDLFLNQGFKKKAIEYLENKSPPHNAFFKVSFLELIGWICQEIINMKITTDQSQLETINDIYIEYLRNRFEFYSIKLYHRTASLTKLVDNTKYILDKIVGIGIYTVAHVDNIRTSGYIEMRVRINNEVSISIFFNQNNTELFSYNNIYIAFWSSVKSIRLWQDISISTIEKICKFLKDFISLRNMELMNINKSNYFLYSDLPEQIINYIESIRRTIFPLKFDRIIDLDIKFEEISYNDVTWEINGTYKNNYFSSTYILIRKLLENLLYDCLKLYYGPAQSEKFFDKNKGHHHGFGILRKNFNAMINDPQFIKKIDKMEQRYIDLLQIFKNKAGIEAHSLFSLPHQKIVEDYKEELNFFIKKLVEIKNKLEKSS